MYNINQDYTSDLKLCERFHYESGVIQLNMFENKIESLKKWQQTRLFDQINRLRNAPGVITPQNNLLNPTEELKKDLTKPIWKCLTQVEPRIVCLENCQKFVQNCISPISSINKLITLFAEKQKNQHSDESNLVISLNRIELQNQKAKTTQNLKLYYQNQQALSSELKQLQFLYNVLVKLQNFLQREQNYQSKKNSLEQTENKNYCPQYLQFCLEIVSYYLKQENIQSYVNIYTMNKILCENLHDVFDFNIGSIAICLAEANNYLSLIIHPLILSIYNALCMQIKIQIKPQNEQMGHIFPDFPIGFSSKIVFINLDGYESQANLQFAKQMSKNLMYFSFPRQQNSKNRQFEKYLSNRFLKKYYYRDCDTKDRHNYYSYFQKKEKDIKKNIYVFPINSLALQQQFDLPDIRNYESNYIKFILEEIAYSQIAQFNPSLIIISYSNKLCIYNEDFEQIIRNMTILGNYRVGFYANFSRTGIFESSQLANFKKILSIDSRKIMEMFEQNYNINDIHTSMTKKVDHNHFVMENHVAINFFDKLARFTKISSGTYSLNKPDEKDDLTTKYKNSKIIRFASILIKNLGKQNINIEKYNMRAENYISISRILQKKLSFSNPIYFQLFNNTLTKFHKNLLKQIEQLLHSSQSTLEQIQQEFKRVLNKIKVRFGNKKISSKWQDIKFQYCLEYTNQKVQNYLLAYIPKYKFSTAEKQNIQQTNQQIGQTSNLIYLVFEIQQENQFYQVNFSKETKFYFQTTRQHKNALIYATNYLTHQQSDHFQHFYAVITPEFQNKLEEKLRLKPIKFNFSLDNYTTFKEFNYFQTDRYIYMFWPQLHDFRLELLSHLAGEKYLSQPTNYIFRALRSKPNEFNLMQIGNIHQCKNISPRVGCKCYSLPEYNTFYIFGGFYINQRNYLDFQTEITIVKDNQTSLQVKNIPKTFYFDYKTQGQKNFVTKLKNDIVRPRIQYEILEVPCQKLGNTQIFLLGGIGQKFLRPYSLLGYMCHKIVFEGPNISTIKRIRMKTIIPINVNQSVKNRAECKQKTIKIAQNRYFFCEEDIVPKESLHYYHHKIYYNPQSASFNDEMEFNYSIACSRTTRNQINLLNKKITDDPQENAQFPIKCYDKKKYSSLFVCLKGQNKLCYQLNKQSDIEILKQSESLKPPDIQSTDTNSTYLYAIVKILYKYGQKYMLACGNINIGQNGNKNSEKLQLKPVYLFDEDVSGNLTITVDKNTIAILHGFNFSEEKQNNPYQTVLKANKSGSFFTNYRVRSHHNRFLCTQYSMKCQVKQSLFLRLLNKIILCFSFRSSKRQFNAQTIAIIIQELNCSDDSQFTWKICKQIEIIFIFNGIAQLEKKHLFKIEKIMPHDLKQRNYLFDIEVTYNAQKYQGILNCAQNGIAKMNPVTINENSQSIITEDKFCLKKELE